MIQVENLSFSYQNNKVFKNLSFSIKKGEYLCIIGKNGSGKSTLAKLLAGLIFQQEGNIKISGYDTKNKTDLLKIRKLIGIIFQNPENQIITTSVFDEVVFGLENLAIPRENIKEIAEKSLKSVSLLEYKDRLTYQLSGGEKQRLAIASVLAMGTEILIFDEATSMLDPVGKKQVLKLMKELNSQGKTIIHITHNRNDILEASEVMLLSKGEIKYQGKPYRIFENDEFNPMKISIKNVGYEYPTFENNKNGIYDVSLEIDSHKRIAIVGHTGSGKSTLLKLIKGLLKKQTGEINIDGRIEDIGYIFQYPEHQIFETTIFKDISYGLKKLKLNEKEILLKVENVLNLVGLDKNYLHHSTLNLSGGEKRRVALAGVLIMQPQLLLLDEATVGLDPEGKEQLFKILLDWQKEENKSFLFITHDMNDVLEYAEEVIVMDKGKLLYHTSPSELFEKYSDKLESLGLELPECISFLNKLNQKLEVHIKIDGDIKEESILLSIREKLK